MDRRFYNIKTLGIKTSQPVLYWFSGKWKFHLLESIPLVNWWYVCVASVGFGIPLEMS